MSITLRADKGESLSFEEADANFDTLDKRRFLATVAPSATDDASKNFEVGSLWADKDSGIDYICTDATIGAAVWVVWTTGEFVALDDGNGSGYTTAYRKANPTMYGSIGLDALDLSISHTEGSDNGATGNGAVALGVHNTALGAYSFVTGLENLAGSIFQTVLGRYNNNKAATLFEIGDGIDANNRSNLLEVYSNGAMHIDKLVGDLNLRPTLTKASNIPYFDTDLDGPIWWNGTTWKHFGSSLIKDYELSYQSCNSVLTIGSQEDILNVQDADLAKIDTDNQAIIMGQPNGTTYSNITANGNMDVESGILLSSKLEDSQPKYVHNGFLSDRDADSPAVNRHIDNSLVSLTVAQYGELPTRSEFEANNSLVSTVLGYSLDTTVQATHVKATNSLLCGSLDFAKTTVAFDITDSICNMRYLYTDSGASGYAHMYLSIVNANIVRFKDPADIHNVDVLGDYLDVDNNFCTIRGTNNYHHKYVGVFQNYTYSYGLVTRDDTVEYSAGNGFYVANNSVEYFKGEVVAMETQTQDMWVADVSFIAKRTSDGVLTVSNLSISDVVKDFPAGVTITFKEEVDAIGGGVIKMYCTGEASSKIVWNTNLRITRVSYDSDLATTTTSSTSTSSGSGGI